MKKRSILFILFFIHNFFWFKFTLVKSGNHYRSRTTGDESKLVKTVVENVLRQKGYTITTTNDNSNNNISEKKIILI
jgi:hypothetical protein